MTKLIDKARIGRTNALAGLPQGHGSGTRIRSLVRHEKVTFISSRARASAAEFMA
jgi:hypothetical protein